jgi:CheY-like chemotaxis protein
MPVPPPVLVAEDDRLLAAVLAELLDSEGYAVVHAAGGRQVLPLALEQRPAVVLLDLLLSDSHGFDVLRALRAHPATAAIPVIVVSGYARQLLPSGGRGAFAVLQKPFDAGELLRLVAAATRAHEPAAGTLGSLDGTGAGDHDLPYRFGGRPRVVAPSPFSTRQLARLLVLRGKVRADRPVTEPCSAPHRAPPDRR